jgi:hypothetical protein
MGGRSAADTVVVTDAFGKQVRSLREKLKSNGEPRKPGDRPRDVLSIPRLAGLIGGCDPSTVTRHENGTFKQIPREMIERLAEALEQPEDQGKLFEAAGILPRTAERALARHRLAIGSAGLRLTASAVQRIDAAMIAEDAYMEYSNEPVPTPVPKALLTGVGKINRHIYVPDTDLGPDTPLVAFRPTGARSLAEGTMDIVIGLPRDLPDPVYQFSLAHAAAHRLLNHDDCQYLAMASPPKGTIEPPRPPDHEQKANDVAVHLLAPRDLVRLAYANALTTITRSDEHADFWAIQTSDVTRNAPPTWVVLVTEVAKELNVPGWLAFRRLTEEHLPDVPGMTGAYQ